MRPALRDDPRNLVEMARQVLAELQKVVEIYGVGIVGVDLHVVVEDDDTLHRRTVVWAVAADMPSARTASESKNFFIKIKINRYWVERCVPGG